MVGEDSLDCSKVTVPLTLESPRRTATVGEERYNGQSLKVSIIEAGINVLIFTQAAMRAPREELHVE